MVPAAGLAGWVKVQASVADVIVVAGAAAVVAAAEAAVEDAETTNAAVVYADAIADRQTTAFVEVAGHVVADPAGFGLKVEADSARALAAKETRQVEKKQYDRTGGVCADADATGAVPEVVG